MTMRTCSRICRKSSFRYWSWLRTFSAASLSRRRSASSAPSICDSTSVPMRTSDSRRLASSLSNVRRGIQMVSSLTEATGDICLGPLVARLVEQVGGGRELDQLTVAVLGVHQHESREVRHAGSLLHVVRHDHDREITG